MFNINQHKLLFACLFVCVRPSHDPPQRQVTTLRPDRQSAAPLCVRGTATQGVAYIDTTQLGSDSHSLNKRLLFRQQALNHFMAKLSQLIAEGMNEFLLLNPLQS